MGLIYGFDDYSNINENKKSKDEKILCIKDFKKVIDKQTCLFNNIKCDDDKEEVLIFKRGDRYKRSRILNTIEGKRAIYIYSNIKSESMDHPTYLYEKFILDNSELDEMEYDFNEFFEF